jgi:hypothetical protein
VPAPPQGGCGAAPQAWSGKMAFLEITTQSDGSVLPPLGGASPGRRTRSRTGTPVLPGRRWLRGAATALIAAALPASTGMVFLDAMENGYMGALGGALGFLLIAPFLPRRVGAQR